MQLAAARWLTTGQVASLCFPELSLEMPRRRIRLLRTNKYMTSRQHNRMSVSLHTLGPQGKDLVLSRGWPRPIHLERALPRNLEHFVGINDIRVTMASRARHGEFSVGFFYASWELQQLGWTALVIPDAACHFARAGAERTVLFEYDRGNEPPNYVARTKFQAYAGGLPGFGPYRVVVIVETKTRQAQLYRYVRAHSGIGQVVVTVREELLGANNVEKILF